MQDCFEDFGIKRKDIRKNSFQSCINRLRYNVALNPNNNYAIHRIN
jgi:hypothetical protein